MLLSKASINESAKRKCFKIVKGRLNNGDVPQVSRLTILQWPHIYFLKN